MCHSQPCTCLVLTCSSVLKCECYVDIVFVIKHYDIGKYFTANKEDDDAIFERTVGRKDVGYKT